MTTRIFVTDLIKSGSFLYDILLEEPRLKDERSIVAAKDTDFDEAENALKEGISLMLERISIMEEELIQAQADEKSVQSSLHKRKMELERSEERLATFMNVRPAYMDEYELLQKDLQGLFSVYVERFRNLQWLEAQLEGFHATEQQKHEEVQCRMRSLQRRFHEEEMKFFQGVDMVSLSIDNDHGSEIGDYGHPTVEIDNCFPISQKCGHFESLGNMKTDTVSLRQSLPSQTKAFSGHLQNLNEASLEQAIRRKNIHSIYGQFLFKSFGSVGKSLGKLTSDGRAGAPEPLQVDLNV